MAIVHLAIYDAVRAITGRRDRSLGLHASRTASPEAAAAAAAHTAMLSLLPSQRSVIDAKFQDSLSQIGGGRQVRRGVRIGERAANRILAARANDGSGATPPVFMPQSGPASTSSPRRTSSSPCSRIGQTSGHLRLRARTSSGPRPRRR